LEWGVGALIVAATTAVGVSIAGTYLAGWKAYLVGGAIGAVFRRAPQVILDVIQGKDWKASLINMFADMALSGLSTVTGYYITITPALKLRAPTLLTKRWSFTVSYIGRDTYRYLGQNILKSVLGTTVRYEQNYVKWVYSRERLYGD
jgi:hypothetical protein